MLDQRGQLLQAAVGFAGRSMPLYDCALWALRTWLDSLVWDRARSRRDAPTGLRPPTDSVRRPRLARDVLHDWDGALADERDGLSIGAYGRRAVQDAAWDDLSKTGRLLAR
jgi:hypothetical protein